MKKWILLIALLFASPVWGTTWYVGQGAGDSDANSCSTAQTDANGSRKLTIQAGLACVGYTAGAGANDIVEVRGGTYTPSLPIGGQNKDQMISGTSWSAPAQLRCRTGQTCTIRGSGQSNLWITNNTTMFVIIGGGTSPATGGFVFDGINVTNDQARTGTCCYGPSSVELLGNEFINTNHQNAIYVGNYSSDIRLRYNYVHGGTFVTTSNGNGRNHAIYFTSNNGLVEFNRIEEIPGYGIHAYYASDASINIFRYNLVKNFGLLSGTACGILVSRNSNQIYGNIVWADNGGSDNGQIGICNSGASNVVFNNTIYGMSYFGIDLTNSSGAVTRNNQIRNTTGKADFLNPAGTLSNNNCGAAATGCASNNYPLLLLSWFRHLMTILQ